MITARTTQRMLTTTVTLTTLGRQKLRSQDLSVSQVLPQISAMNPNRSAVKKKRPARYCPSLKSSGLLIELESNLAVTFLRSHSKTAGPGLEDKAFHWQPPDEPTLVNRFCPVARTALVSADPLWMVQ